jgi:peroxiredoxin
VGFAGGQGSLADFRGTPVVVNFFASTCVPCRSEMPDFESVHQRRGATVQFVGINTGEAIAPGRRIASDTGVTYPLLSDPPGATMTALGSVVLPTTVLADANGTVLDVHHGVLTDTQLEQWIDDNLQKATPS